MTKTGPDKKTDKPDDNGIKSSASNKPANKTGVTDGEIRELAQEAGTDMELESMVPPKTPIWGPASWWRIGLVVLALLILVILVLR